MNGYFTRIVVIGYLIPEPDWDELTGCTHNLGPPFPYLHLGDAAERFVGTCNLVILGGPVDHLALAEFLDEHGSPPVIGLLGEQHYNRYNCEQVTKFCEIADLCGPVIHLHVDVEMPVAVPRGLDFFGPDALQVRRQPPPGRDEQMRRYRPKLK